MQRRKQRSVRLLPPMFPCFPIVIRLDRSCISPHSSISHNIESLKFYAQFADVVVLARELNLEQVADIHRQIVEQNICGPSGKQIRIEMFCHGALCMAVSGKCYLSLDNLNHSANRGACMQVCRRGYTVKDRETGVELDVDNQYIMSPKDLNTIGSSIK